MNIVFGQWLHIYSIFILQTFNCLVDLTEEMVSTLKLSGWVVQFVCCIFFIFSNVIYSLISNSNGLTEVEYVGVNKTCLYQCLEVWLVVLLWISFKTVAVFHAARGSIPLDPGYSQWAPTLSITSNPKLLFKKT